jgi:F0F1-type ATP synthase membrane subunit b/b'
MELGARRKALLQVVLAARPGGRGVDAAGPSDLDIARLSDAVATLESKSEDQAREVQAARRDLDTHENQLAKAKDALARLEAVAVQESRVPQGRSGPAQDPRPSAQTASPGPAATPPQASPLQEAKQRRAEAKSLLEAAEIRFEKARGPVQERLQSARDEAAKLRGWVEGVGSKDGVLHGMKNKTCRDSNDCLTALGLPCLKDDGDKASQQQLRRQFLTYRAGLAERRPDDRWQFRATVVPGLPRLMAFDALIRTHLSMSIESLPTAACLAHEWPLAGLDDPDPETLRNVARDMASRRMERVSAIVGELASDKMVPVSGRQKVDKLARQRGAPAAEARPLHQLRTKDLSDVGPNARLLQELLHDNRADLEDTLGRFITTGLEGVRSERARLAGEAEAVLRQANQPDPELTARMMEVVEARKAHKQADAKVQAFGPEPRDLPRPDATPAQRAAAIPQTQAAPSGPGLAQDVEIRIARQRGRILKLEAARDLARQRHGDASRVLRQAEEAQQNAREHFEAAWAVHRQAREAAQQELAQLRVERGEHGARLGEFDRQIGQARADLRTDPALLGLIDRWALQRVIEVHVDPNDDALRRRALEETGLNGRYDSLEHMAQAVVDVHEAAKSRFPQLFAARTLQEFEQAANKHPEYDVERKALVNIPHEHGRLVGQGYDAKPDRTSRLIPLTRSEFGLAWREGRVVVSHLHPGVPRRTLRTLA